MTSQREHEAALAAARQEVSDFIAILNEDADGRLILDGEKLREGVAHPCALCGWTLDGHKYVYGTSRGSAHLHCSHTLRAVEKDALGAELTALRRAARAVVDAAPVWGRAIETSGVVSGLRAVLGDA